jgi:hypothetical protein
MWKLLTNEEEVYIHSGFIYVPLKFDLQIDMEVKTLAGEAAALQTEVLEKTGEVLLSVNGNYFVKSLSINCLVENYPAAFPEEFEKNRLQLRQHVFPEAVIYHPPLDPRVTIILFEILPHFWRRRRGRRREKNGRKAVLSYLAAKLGESFNADINIQELRERRKILRQGLSRLDSREKRQPLHLEVQKSGKALVDWFQEALQWKLVSQEIENWQRELDKVENLLNLPEVELTVLLAVAARGAVEVDGFGFCPDEQRPGEYWIYLRTGEYVLQDYFGRWYLFPDCRVAVSTAGPFHPMVLETYKHPLLRRFKDRQQICLTDYQPESEFSAAAVSRALGEGLNALFYGYNSRKRNGYNSLDKFGRHQSVVEFVDWRISQDDGRVLRGELEVKNRSI